MAAVGWKPPEVPSPRRCRHRAWCRGARRM